MSDPGDQYIGTPTRRAPKKDNGTLDMFDCRFDGSDYVDDRDRKRLTGQILRIHSLMSDGAWRTLREIADKTGDPEASVSAQLRNLRKVRFGKHEVGKRNRGNPSGGLFEYRLVL